MGWADCLLPTAIGYLSYRVIRGKSEELWRAVQRVDLIYSLIESSLTYCRKSSKESEHIGRNVRSLSGALTTMSC